ncbi:MAG: PadR family transcriptional regulator [Flammeovirgaceae bacterium]|nr:PadR family transcriptional regulator [Flammeovirgaceae bacterium]MBE62295.1 PadR family transcriptional regulator [Flammeovirgaceae bacterium]MBR09206.1 PadR family transcriptional regulator [Rickettsiales bacterium]|tara:strand:- start:448 stop:783 length:336 start_codon:yes stop_codon:yes gene_type:complete
MKGTQIGELEEIILLTVGTLYDDAYGVAVMQNVEERTGRKLTISTVHSVLKRLEEKGYCESRYDGATKERGGRRKHLFRVTVAGEKVLHESREIRNQLWNAIPGIAFNRGE